jgi:hypothetical protein
MKQTLFLTTNKRKKMVLDWPCTVYFTRFNRKTHIGVECSGARKTGRPRMTWKRTQKGTAECSEKLESGKRTSLRLNQVEDHEGPMFHRGAKAEKNCESITSWSRGLPEKLTGPQLLNKYPAFYGN